MNVWKEFLFIFLFSVMQCFEFKGGLILELKIMLMQGFPRADIDIPTVRAQRNRLAGMHSAYN